DLFPRIEIVSEKDAATYARVLAEFDLAPAQFAMVGNSLRSDIAPVLALGGWGVHMPYHVTWVHETHAALPDGTAARLREAATPPRVARPLPLVPTHEGLHPTDARLPARRRRAVRRAGAGARPRVQAELQPLRLVRVLQDRVRHRRGHLQRRPQPAGEDHRQG